jgi:hypothetical protein
MVKYCLNEIYQHINEDEQINLLKTLIEITEGRIYVEVNNTFNFSMNIPFV